MAVTDRMLVEYLRRAYHAVDGLWFVKAEEERGFEAALELDRQVWEVLAKIQARKARELTESGGHSAEELARCFGLKLTADGHEFATETSPGTLTFRLAGCPWLELLKRSDREDLALRIAEAVCLTEGRVWCGEFGSEWEFDMPQMGCAGGETCAMRFTRAGVRARHESPA